MEFPWDHLAILPDSLLLAIFRWLAVEDLVLGVRQVCHRWHQLSYDRSLWRHLDLSNKVNSITDDTFHSILSGISHALESLNLSGCRRLTENGILHDGLFCENLKDVNLSRTKLTDWGLKHLIEKYENLERINIQQCRRIQQAYKILSSLENLQVFLDPYDEGFIKQTEIGMDLENIARNNRELYKAGLSNEDMKDSDLIRFLGACGGLEDLAVQGCKMVGDEALVESIGKLHLLRSINLSATQITDRALQLIGHQCRRLLHVCLSDCGHVTDIGIIALLGQIGPQLRSLVIADADAFNCNVTDLGLEAIGAMCPQLQQLSICNASSISDAGLERVARGCPLLTSLEVKACLSLSENGFYALAQHCNQLQHVNASECIQLSASGFSCIVRACPQLNSLRLQTCHYLRKLDFSGRTIRRFSEALRQQGEELENGISIRQDGGQTVGQGQTCFHYNLALVDLSFCSKIEDSSVTALAHNCPALEGVHLRGCYLITDESVAQLARHCHKLRVLEMAGGALLQTSRLTDTSLQALSLHARQLQMLTMDKNPRVTLSGLSAILRGCRLLHKIWLTVSPQTMPMPAVIDAIRSSRRKCWLRDVASDFVTADMRGDYLLKFPAMRGCEGQDGQP